MVRYSFYWIFMHCRTGVVRDNYLWPVVHGSRIFLYSNPYYYLDSFSDNDSFLSGNSPPTDEDNPFESFTGSTTYDPLDIYRSNSEVLDRREASYPSGCYDDYYSRNPDEDIVTDDYDYYSD